MQAPHQSSAPTLRSTRVKLRLGATARPFLDFRCDVDVITTTQRVYDICHFGYYSKRPGSTSVQCFPSLSTGLAFHPAWPRSSLFFFNVNKSFASYNGKIMGSVIPE